MFWRHTQAVGPLACNCSIIADLEARKAIVVDPGGAPEAILGVLRRRQLTLLAIVHTHAHIDHVYATAELAEATGAPASLHAADRPLYAALDVQAMLLGIAPPRRDAMVGDLQDDGCLSFGAFELATMHTPGHSQGSVSFVVPRARCCLTGDTLFANGVGRTDLWGGDARALRHSIERRLLPLEDDVQVVPGHGAETSMGRERRHWPAWQRRLGG